MQPISNSFMDQPWSLVTQFLPGGLRTADLLDLALVVGVATSLLLYVGIVFQLQKLRYVLALHKQRAQGLEKQLLMISGGGDESQSAAAPDDTRQKVLHLHDQGRSSGEIAQQAGIREAEVDFVLRVNEHLGQTGRHLALQKIS